MDSNIVLTSRASESDVRLIAEFKKASDRWSHTVSVQRGTEPAQLLLSSIEGTPDQVWPPCPPLQEVTYHELPDGAAALAVGMAGKSHWSASFQDQQNGIIKADIACLAKSPDPVLGSNYQLGPGTSVTASIAGSTIQNGDFKIELTGLPIDGVLPEFEVEEGRLTFAPAVSQNRPAAAVRWCFQIRVAD